MDFRNNLNGNVGDIDEMLDMRKDIQEIYKNSMDIMMNLKDINMTMIYLVDNSTNQAVLVSYRNVPHAYLERASRIDRPRGITWKLITENHILNIKNSQDDDTIGPAGKALGKKGVYGIPITMGGSSGEARGVIWLWSDAEIDFDSDDHKLVLYIASKVGMAITWSEKYNKRREEWKNKFADNQAPS